tara:strand:- start:9739 stop:10107 length:369 start_codon:yes stop_codon:yes gene_type:complete
MKDLNFFIDKVNEGYKIKSNRKLGKTKSGKVVYANKQDDAKSFDLQELQDAKKIIWSEMQRLQKLGRTGGNGYKQLNWLNGSYGFMISKLDGSFTKDKKKEEEHWLSRKNITDKMKPDTNFN